MVRVPRYQHPAAGGWPHSPRTRNRLPWSVPLDQFTRRVRTPIPAYIGQSVISAGGAATVQLGPAGYGVRWYPAQAKIATTSGANDASTCILYAGVIAASTQIGAQSYAGGGDTIGLAGDMLQPGEFIFAVWSGGKTGDIATLRLVGVQEALV